MPKNDKTEIICVLDRSGSMNGIRDDCIGGFNAFIAEQKQVPGETNVTVMQFDDEFTMTHVGTPLAEVPPLDETTFVPRGSTALLDAIGRTINETEARLGKMPDEEQPGLVLVLILTDGHENASKEFNKGQIDKMVKEHEAKGWEFMYLKAGPDSFAEAGAIGISARNYANVGASRKGMIGAFRAASNMAARYRAGGQSAVVSCSLQADASDNSGQLTPEGLQGARGQSGNMLSEEAEGGEGSANVLQQFLNQTDSSYGGMLQNLADDEEEKDA